MLTIFFFKSSFYRQSELVTEILRKWHDKCSIFEKNGQTTFWHFSLFFFYFNNFSGLLPRLGKLLIFIDKHNRMYTTFLFTPKLCKHSLHVCWLYGKETKSTLKRTFPFNP